MGKVSMSGIVSQLTVPMPSKFQLYDKGNENITVTGGWESIGLGINPTYITAAAPSITKNTNNLTLKQTTGPGPYNSGVVKTIKKIPLKNVKHVYFDIEATSAGSAIIECLVMKKIDNTVEQSTTAKASVLVYTTEPASGVFSINVSSITDECYIGILLYQESTVIVNKIWTE